MRLLIVAALLVLSACTEASSSRIDDRTFRIQGSGPSASDAPNRRLATRLCPNGYRVIDRDERRNTPDGYLVVEGSVFTNWKIRCI